MELEKARNDVYTTIFYCPERDLREVDSKISGVPKELGNSPVGKAKLIKCRFGINHPPHKDSQVIIAITFSAIADHAVKTEAMATAVQMFPHKSPPIP